MSALPLNLIKGTTSASYERLENTEDIEEVEQHLLRIKSKVRSSLFNILNDFFPWLLVHGHAVESLFQKE